MQRAAPHALPLGDRQMKIREGISIGSRCFRGNLGVSGGSAGFARPVRGKPRLSAAQGNGLTLLSYPMQRASAAAAIRLLATSASRDQSLSTQ